MQRPNHPFFEGRAGRLLDQVYQCLGVGLGHEAVAVLLQRLRSTSAFSMMPL